MRKVFSIAIGVALIPALAFAGEITLTNLAETPVEIRAVRKGVVKIAPAETKVFLYQAEDGDFRVWTAGDRCNHIFFYETSDDARLAVMPGPVLYKLPPGAGGTVGAAEMAASQPKGWPMKPDQKECD